MKGKKVLYKNINQIKNKQKLINTSILNNDNVVLVKNKLRILHNKNKFYKIKGIPKII